MNEKVDDDSVTSLDIRLRIVALQEAVRSADDDGETIKLTIVRANTYYGFLSGGIESDKMYREISALLEPIPEGIIVQQDRWGVKIIDTLTTWQTGIDFKEFRAGEHLKLLPMRMAGLADCRAQAKAANIARAARLADC